VFQEKFIIKSYAKINLHLEVLNKRKDNYHNLFSLMGELELADFLKLESFNITGKQEPVIVDIH
jgi:4-diphosphocytidyl-2-C-methyl-D-erythritol kinase